jgi:hypothetical protein
MRTKKVDQMRTELVAELLDAKLRTRQATLHVTVQAALLASFEIENERQEIQAAVRKGEPVPPPSTKVETDCLPGGPVPLLVAVLAGPPMHVGG